jgi:hypothetical protein
VYKITHFHPRESAFGGSKVTSDGSHGPLIGVYNASAYARVILVRGFIVTCSGSSGAWMGTIQGNLSATLLNSSPFYASDALPAGKVFVTQAADGTFGTDNLALAGNTPFTWSSDRPLCALPFGWSFIVTAGATTATLFGSFMWEELTPEQLDEGRWLAANLALANNG